MSWLGWDHKVGLAKLGHKPNASQLDGFPNDHVMACLVVDHLQKNILPNLT